MTRNFVEADTKKGRDAYWPIIGFIMIVVLGGIAYVISPGVVSWLTHTSWSTATGSVLPIHFPPTWSSTTVQLVVALGIFLVLFVIATIGLLIVMGTPSGPTDVSLQELRNEKKKTSKKRRR
jgi:uncharacterized membrane protein YhaH (DUF805 family)